MVLFLPATHLSWSQTLEGLFELTGCPLSALNLAPGVASGTTEIQVTRTLSGDAALGAEVPGIR